MNPAGSGPCLQERYAPQSICYGCGPANAEGLHIRSFPIRDGESALTAEWAPAPRHQAFPGTLNGGVIGTLLDCHSNWTAAYHLMQRRGADTPPTTVTAEYSIRLRRPTPVARPLTLRSRVLEAAGNRVMVEAELLSEEDVTASCRGTFVAVPEGHPAYGRW